MHQLYRHCVFLFFAFLVAGLAFQISCVEVGPVPEFEYSYEFETQFPDIAIDDPITDPVNFTPGSVTEQMTQFRDDLTNAATASNYAGAVGTVLDPGQQTFWGNQNQSNIASQLETGNAALLTQLNAASADFQGNGTLQNLIPSIINATGSTPSGRVASNGRTTGVAEIADANSVAGTQQLDDEFDDCRQAAQDAFEEAVAIVDQQLADQLAAVDTWYQNQIGLLNTQVPTLETAATARHQTRIAAYLSLFNQIATNINALGITQPEKDLLNLANLVIYALHYNASLTLLTFELNLIATLETQTATLFDTARTNYISQINSNYTAEINRLTSVRNSTQNACHNQGGVNSN